MSYSSKQLSFSGGEIAPALHARVDTAKYATGLHTCRNMNILRSGGAQSRGGMEFIAEVKDSTTKVRLIPLVYSESLTYLLEFGSVGGAGYMRAYYNGVQVTTTGADRSITGITQANPGVITSVAHGFSNGNEVSLSLVVGMTQLNGRNFKVANVTANTFTLKYMDGSTDVNTTAFGAYVSGGTVKKVWEISANVPSTGLQQFQVTQASRTTAVTALQPSIIFTHPSAPIGFFPIASIGLTTPTAFSSFSESATLAVPTGITPTTPGAVSFYAVTSTDSDGEESIANYFSSGAVNDSIVCGLNAGNRIYTIYKRVNGIYSFIGVTANNTTFVDSGVTPTITVNPPEASSVFVGSDNYPGVMSTYQSRAAFARTNNNRDTVFLSYIGSPENLLIKFPITDENRIIFSLAARREVEIRHILDVGRMIVLTTGGEFVIEGDQAGILRPAEINARQKGYYGADYPTPQIIGTNVLYVQARKSIIRDLNTTEFKNVDITVFASHLFDDKTITDLAYQQSPSSIMSAVRSDGVLLGLTYIPEHEIWAWHRHDTDGTFENVASVPEGAEDAVYVVVKRTIGGATKRYIERMVNRNFANVEDFIGLDSNLSYNGANATATTMALTATKTFTVTIASPGVFTATAHGYAVGDVLYFTTSGTLPTGLTAATAYYVVSVPTADTFTVSATSGGAAVNTSGAQAGTHIVSSWTYSQTLTLTASASFFVAGDVGNAIHLTGSDGTVIRFTIVAYTSATVVTGRAHKTVPVVMRTGTMLVWSKAVDVISGLWHLEGKSIAVFADGFVAANPNNPAYDVITVTNGSATLDRPYAVIHAGLPYFCDLQTLNIDSPSGETMSDKKKLVTRVTAKVEESRGMWVGAAPPANDTTAPLDGLTEIKLRNTESYDEPIDLVTGDVEVNIRSEWNSNGRVFLRQIDPVPMTILAICPIGMLPTRGA